MDKKLNLIITAALLATLLIVAAVAYDYLTRGSTPDPLATLSPTRSTGETAETSPRQEAPDFTVYDSEGRAHRLSDFRGKPVILNFWASWCGPCKSEMPDFDEAFAQYGSNIHFLMVNLTDGYQETRESAASYIAQEGYRFPVYYDTDTDAAATYGVSAIPVTYFIDAEGFLVAMGQSALTADALSRGIAMLTE